MEAAAAGTFAGQIVLVNDDGDEAAFAINLSGSAVPSVQIIDNGAAGNARVGAWTSVGNKGYQSDIHVATKGTGSKQATWTFSALPAGEYRVWATWTGGSANASNAPFQIIYGGSSAPTIRVNQKNAAAGLTADGGKWNFLGSVNATKGWLQVKLNNSANGTVVADAIRLVYVPSGAALVLGASGVLSVAAPSELAADAALAWTTQTERSAEAHIQSPVFNAQPQPGRDDVRRNWDQELPAPGIVAEETLELICSAKPTADATNLIDAAMEELQRW
jgi:hypothetical protein